jgi:hypothetical protein
MTVAPAQSVVPGLSAQFAQGLPVRRKKETNVLLKEKDLNFLM